MAAHVAEERSTVLIRASGARPSRPLLWVGPLLRLGWQLGWGCRLLRCGSGHRLLLLLRQWWAALQIAVTCPAYLGATSSMCCQLICCPLQRHLLATVRQVR